MATFDVLTPGRVGYSQAWDQQRALHSERVDGLRGDTVLLLQHDAVYTAGKRTEPWERPNDGTAVIDVDRGGKITWHGPGQLVGYPILKLADPIDVVAYVRRMERMLIGVCATLGVAAVQIEGRSGVWLAAGTPDSRTSNALAPDGSAPDGSAPDGSAPNAAAAGRGAGQDRKIAAIGIRIARGVTLHGFALNCNPDLRAYDRIVPCGISDASVTSLSQELGRDVTVEEVLPIVSAALIELVEPALVSARSTSVSEIG